MSGCFYARWWSSAGLIFPEVLKPGGSSPGTDATHIPYSINWQRSGREGNPENGSTGSGPDIPTVPTPEPATKAGPALSSHSLNHARPARLIKAQLKHPVQTLSHLIYVRNHYDLCKALMQLPQQLHHIVPSALIK